MATKRAIKLTHDLPLCDQWDWPLNNNDGIVRLQNLPDRFQVELDALHFTPKEISVEVTGNKLAVKCQHDNRQDPHGSIARTICRNYRLPADVDMSTLSTHLTNRGVLRITAKKRSLCALPIVDCIARRRPSNEGI